MQRGGDEEVEGPRSTGLVGSHLSHFHVVARLGEGGMGVVYKAIDEKLRRPVALKVLNARLAADDRNREILFREARSAAAVSHANIAAIHELHDEGIQPFIAMEYVEGETLRARLARDGKLGTAQALSIAREVAAALARAHAAGVVHRDLKPENVMVASDGHVKVLDFGIAKVAEEAEVVVATSAPRFPGDAERALGNAPTLAADSHPTERGRVVGTPAYMSPEQAVGDLVDARTDVFAFGIVLHEMLTGAPPFVRASDDPNRWKPPPSDEWKVREAAEDPRLERIIRECLGPEPGARFRDGSALVEAIASLGIGSERAPEPPPARSGWVVGSLAALALVAVAAVAIAWRAPRAGIGPAPGPVPSATGAAPPVAITDLPTPATLSEAARAAYVEGMDAERQGNSGALRLAMRKATVADPEMAAAWLRLALIDFFTSDVEGARKAIGKVPALAAKLDEHDRALEAAASALILSDPPGWDAFTARAADALERFPGDAELANHYAFALYRQGHFAEAKDAYEATMRLDPQMGEPYMFEANAQAALGDLAGALATTEGCQQILPTSSVCQRPRQHLHEQLGDCAALEADGRAEALRDPASEGYATVAEALATEGRPKEAVRGALDMWLAKVDAEYRKKLGMEFTALLADWSGDFAASERIGRELETMTAGVASEEEQGIPLALRALAFVEEGRADDARRVAEQFLVREPTWLAGARYSIAGLRSAFTPAMLDLARAGMGPGEFERRRDAWAKDWADHMTGPNRHAIWFPAYATTAEDARDAKRALEVLPDYAPLPAYRPQTTWDAAEGYVYLLAGDAARALPLLERGSKVCLALSDPLGHVTAKLHLGMAREATGDRAGACASYAEVVAQWGKAKPRSVTAEKAAERARALGCSRNRTDQ